MTDLPFDDNSFDLVSCQFGAMFFPEGVKAYREVHRVVRKGGFFVFSMWDRLEANEFAFEVTSALAEVFPDDPPSFLDRTPHGHYEWGTYRSELAVAGFDQVTIEAIDAVSAASDPSIPVIAYCEGRHCGSRLEPGTRQLSNTLLDRPPGQSVNDSETARSPVRSVDSLSPPTRSSLSGWFSCGRPDVL